MRARTESILESGVREFIKTGQPITSGDLYRKYRFGIKPAMIRWELNDLSEAGYFYQIHPSGGRFPTDKAYRFLVRHLLHDNEEDVWINAHISQFIGLMEEFLEGEREHLIQELSGYLGVLSVGYEPAAEWMSSSGFKDLFSSLELDDRADFVEIVKDFEFLQDRLAKNVNQWQKDEVWPRVFVGKNPITKSHHLSVVAQRLTMSDDDVFIIAIGPKRMDYEKSLGVLKYLEKAL